MGVLLVDTIRSKRRLSHSDISLLMGIAPQIAISINNALSYQKIQESEQRFRSLSENAPDIIYTLDVEGALLRKPGMGNDPGPFGKRKHRKVSLSISPADDDIRLFRDNFAQVRDKKRDHKGNSWDI